MHLRSLVLVSLTALAGCGGGDDATGPSPVPRTANVGGSWTISITNLSGSVGSVGVSCFFTGAPMVLSQTGAAFTGTYGPAELSCHAAGESVSVMSQGVVVNGTVTGDDVAFDFDTQDAHQRGHGLGQFHERDRALPGGRGSAVRTRDAERLVGSGPAVDQPATRARSGQGSSSRPTRMSSSRSGQ